MSPQADHKLRSSELRTHSDEELSSLIGSLSEELFKYRMQRYTNQLENTMQIRKLRRDLARVKTILSARGLGLEVRQEGGVEPAGEAAAKPAPQQRAAKGKAKAKTKAKRATAKAAHAAAKTGKAKPTKAKSKPAKKTKAKSAQVQE